MIPPEVKQIQSAQIQEQLELPPAFTQAIAFRARFLQLRLSSKEKKIAQLFMLAFKTSYKEVGSTIGNHFWSKMQPIDIANVVRSWDIYDFNLKFFSSFIETCSDDKSLRLIFQSISTRKDAVIFLAHGIHSLLSQRNNGCLSFGKKKREQLGEERKKQILAKVLHYAKNNPKNTLLSLAKVGSNHYPSLIRALNNNPLICDLVEKFISEKKKELAELSFEALKKKKQLIRLFFENNFSNLPEPAAFLIKLKSFPLSESFRLFQAVPTKYFHPFIQSYLADKLSFDENHYLEQVASQLPHKKAELLLRQLSSKPQYFNQTFHNLSSTSSRKA